jgi:1-pyrroline-5-carboxylate dehydrogenase
MAFSSKRWKFFLSCSSVATFALGFLAKEVVATLPFVLLILDYLFLSSGDIKSIWKRKNVHIAYWCVLFGYMVFRHTHYGLFGDLGEATYSRWTHASYFITQFYVIANYLKMLLFLTGQSFDHYILPSVSVFETRIIFSISVLFITAIFWFYLLVNGGSGTNDKAGAKVNLLRWTSLRTIKETFVPSTDYKYPFLDKE